MVQHPPTDNLGERGLSGDEMFLSGLVSDSNLTRSPTPPGIQVISQRFDKFPKCQVVSICINSQAPKVKSYFFTPRPRDTRSQLWSPTDRSTANTNEEFHPAQTGSVARRSGRTRIKPPLDVVKLQDRLLLTLQPTLESIVANNCIDFPFTPFGYQYAGIAFLFPRHSAILADEMGLGKTMQAIVTMRLLLRDAQLKNVLLICPKPLVTNWVKEFRQWAPEIPVCVIQGNKAKRTWQWEDSQTPVRIANYELLTRDQEIISSKDVSFDLVVLDEAQRIKNKSSATSKAACSIRRNRSWALTGTPIENSTDDLVGIFEFLSRGYLHSGMPLKSLRDAVRDHILRRTKTEVLTDMPPLLHRDALLELSAEQQHTYDQAESLGVVRLNELGAEITIQHVFELVLRLKQICNFDLASGKSSKMERLQAELDEVISSGQKAIVFSQWVKTLDLIAGNILAANPLAFHGKVPMRQRDAVLDEFRENADRHVLLMSYGAGSVGLNLQFCRYVFLFDQWWNPAVEDQAINRAHRIGSSGSVTVTRFVSAGTIEERINDVLQSKRELFETVLSDTDQPAQLGMSRAEILGLFDLTAAGQPIRQIA